MKLYALTHRRADAILHLAKGTFTYIPKKDDDDDDNNNTPVQNKYGFEIVVSHANSIELIGQMAIPLCLITLGVSLATLKLRNFYISFYIVIYRTIICLAVSIGVALYFDFPDVPTAILILQLTTPVAVTSYLLSEKYKRNPSEVASLVVLSTVLSIFYIPIILSFLKY